MFRWACAVVTLVPLLTLWLPLAQPAAAASPPANPPATLDVDVPDGHFYTEANGAAVGTTSTGFLIGDDGGVAFWSSFQRLGAVPQLGYPISGRFMLDGFVAQATQRAVLQWQPATQSVALVNVFDRLHDAGKDAWLKSFYQIPPPVQLDEKGLTFAQIEQKRLALLDANAAIKGRYQAAADPLLLYGLPTSAPVDFGPVVVVRTQRAAFQLWKVAMPWAKAGDVTVVNGGDIAKAAGLIPSLALAPAASPVVDGQAANLPWSGWWWPASLQPPTPPYLFDNGGPLDMYDRYVVAGGAPSPGVQQWERQHILWTDPKFFWAGHCNGWAAAALLEPEPKAPLTARGVTFSVADQKGLLSDYHFADTPVWEYGSLTESMAPADLQRMVLQWLGQKRLGFIIDDYTTSDQIESFPVYRFRMVYIPDPLDPNKTHVQLTLWMAEYNVPPNFVGLKDHPSSAGQRFDYFIYGPKDNPTGGDWEGVSLVGVHGHPRFIWYPNPAVRNVGRTLTDPALDYATIQQILGRPQPKAATSDAAPGEAAFAAGTRQVPWLGGD